MRKITLPRGGIPYGDGKGSYRRCSPPMLHTGMICALSCLTELTGALFAVIFMLFFFPQRSAAQSHSLFNPPAPSWNPSTTAALWPITIVTHPADVLDCESHVVTFRVVISGGTAPVTYTWQRQRPEESSFTDIPAGATGISYPSPGTLRVANVGGNENPSFTRYRVVISDPGGSITSNPALLTVNEITDIMPSVAFPSKTHVILCEGADFSYTISTSGSPPVAYQWKKYVSSGVWANVTDNGIISGCQSAVLSFTGATVSESGEYKVNITFHSSGADCQVESAGRTRVLTIQSVPEGPFIAEPLPACQGMTPDPLTALPPEGGSGDFNYQWQESPDGTSWTNIPGAASLSYQPPPPSTPSWYRIKATDVGIVTCGNPVSLPVLQEVEDCINRHYRTVKDGIWSDRTIWETSPDAVTWGGIAYTFPTSSVRTITIRDGHTVTVSQDVTVDEVTVEAGGTVIVDTEVTLGNVTGNAGDFIIKSEQEPPSGNGSGSLIQYGSYSGPLTYERRMQAGGLHYFSSPVVSNSSANPGKINKVYLWEETTGSWNLTNITGLIFGRGYCIDPTDSSDGIITFTGQVAKTASVTATSPFTSDYMTGTRAEYDSRWANASPKRSFYGGGGWNLLGNPFPSAMDANAFITNPTNASSFDPNYKAMYIYDGENKKYWWIGAMGGDWTAPGDNFGSIIQAGQGFFVLAQKNNVPFIFDAFSMQIHSSATPFKSAAVGECWPGVVLKVGYNHKFNSTTVIYHEKMTAGLDPGYDVGQLSAGPDVEIYTALVEDNGLNFTCQALPLDECEKYIIPVGIDTKNGGMVTFSAGMMSMENGTFLLEDRTAGAVTDLGKTTYLVTLPANTYGTGRFFLYFRKHVTSEAGIKQLAEVRAWYENGKICLKAKAEPEAEAELFDLQGRRLGTWKFQRPGLNQIPVKGLPGGIYLVQIRIMGERQVVKVTVNWK